jgi:hypothetical protein
MKEVTEQIRQFLEMPLRWTPPDYGSEEMRQAAIDMIAREFHQRLHGFVRNRMIIIPRADWTTAFERSGQGSTKVRARDIDSIYHIVAPTLAEIVQSLEGEHLSTSLFSGTDSIREMGKDDAFTIQVILFVKEAIEAMGGKLIRSNF